MKYLYTSRSKTEAGSRRREGESKRRGQRENDGQQMGEREWNLQTGGVQSTKVAVERTTGLRLEIVENPDLHPSGFVEYFFFAYIIWRYLAIQ